MRILHDNADIDCETEDFETLSGGTQEQIGIPTRLNFARLFARREQHLQIILDDALVYSDDDMIVNMFTAMKRLGLEQQIVLSPCRHLTFAGLGGERPRILEVPLG